MTSLFAALRRGASPAQLIVLSFLGALLAGAALLTLPASHAAGARVGLLDALFTATSAVCVTGLATLDTGGAYSRFGQVVILLLVQVGGLGVLTLGVLLTLATGRRVGFGARLQLQAQLNTAQVGGVVKLLRRILAAVFALELAGTLLLYPRFAALEGPAEGLFYAAFHSVSAFNNAGFSLYRDSLVRFAGDPLVSLTVAGLVLLGGLGFPVLFNLLAHLRRGRRAPLSLHSKLALLATLLLTLGGFSLLLVFEWRNPETLAALPPGDRVLAAFFQAVMPRTAGFNSLDYSDLTDASLAFTLLLMFIGANPGSTGGGIKTVTFAVLLGSSWAIVRGRGELDLFGRRVRANTVVRAGVITFTGVLAVGAATTLLAVTEPGQNLTALAFESVSAFATVGLSLGITPDLSAPGKLVIISLMFLGRIGLLTFALALAKASSEAPVRYPAEEVLIG